MATNTTNNAIPCPDPSVHQHKDRLSEQASSAALYVTHPERATEVRAMEKEHPLGPDGKLSSKSAATSLKHARAQDLPSFPTHGLGADSASKAALLAKDYKMKELWHPELSAAGSKAALIAHDKGGKLDLWQPSATAEGNSAATLAMRNKTLSPQLDYGYTPDGKNRALMAATMSVNKGRQRAGSTPVPVHPAYPDSHNASHNALNAATVSHRTSIVKPTTDGWDSEANQAARITHLGDRMDKAMFTERPPVDIEREEAAHNAALRASAVSMAKKMYDQQARPDSPAAETNIAGAGAGAAHARNPSASQPVDLKQEAMRYINLQEAAHKLAAERLAKVDKNFEAARYREYYGYGGEEKPKRISSRFSLRAGRGRASSEADADPDDSDDEGQARRIRSQMSQLNSGLNSVENKKQQDDRAKLLAAAEKRVSARMQNMDEKVFEKTGKVPPAMMEEWEEKARKRAQEERVEKAQHTGKTHIGGGKYMDQSEIEAIAAARLKPTLDEINDTAEKKRARDEELRLEKEEQERSKREEKARNREEKDEQKRVKNEEKAVAKREKDEAKARKEEEKRAAKEDKRKSRDVKREDVAGVAVAGAAGATLGDVADKVKDENDPSNEPSAQAGVEKHRSALSKLKDRFKRSDKKEAEVDDENVADRPTTSTATGVAAVPAVSAATEPTLEEPASLPATIDPQQAAHAVEADERLEDDDDDDDDVFEPAQTTLHEVPAILVGGAAAGELADEPHSTAQSSYFGAADRDVSNTLVAERPQRPRFEQKASLAGLHNDEEDPNIYRMPDLERHISQIPDMSDDEEDSDSDDEELERQLTNIGRNGAHQTAERVVAAPVTATSAAGVTSVSRAQPEPVSPLGEERDLAEPSSAIPSQSAGRNITQRSTSTEPFASSSNAATAPVVPTGPSATGESSTLNESAVPAAGAAAGLSDEHHHNKLHKNPPPKVLEELNAAAAAQSTPAATSSDPTGKLSVDAGSRPSVSNDDGEKEHKGIRGLFNKLRSKPSRPENKYPDFKSPTKAAVSQDLTPKPAAAATATSSALPAKAPHIGTDGPIGDPTHVSGLAGNPRAESISSFRRGDAAAKDLDDVSSSGAEEEDLQRGRGGRLGRTLGMGKGKGRATDAERESVEEARDHFDESAAPRPAFAGQAKNESPVRGTRFQEEL